MLPSGAGDHHVVGADRLHGPARHGVADAIAGDPLGGRILQIRDGRAVAQHDAEEVRLHRGGGGDGGAVGGLSVRVGLNRLRAATAV